MNFIVKSTIGDVLNSPWLRKSLIIMRCILLFLLLGTMQITASVTYSQTVRLSLNIKNKPLQEVLSIIEQKSSFYFTYNLRQINADRKVSVDVKDKSVSEVLDKLLKNSDVKYVINDKHIVLYKEKEHELSLEKQQVKMIKGIVTDVNGEPIVGANVVEKGTTNGTITDIDGNFSLNVSGSTLLVSYIGYISQEISLQGQNTISVRLQEDTQSLEEVVVVGYGVQKKKLTTGATIQVKGEDLQKLSTTSPLTAMQSQSPGVTIVQESGKPGSSFKVNVRGIGTIGNSDPLYIIDGYVGGDINLVTPSDIESIDVLKDAASSAIYGARAANGVILVTTKRGKAGKAHISYDGYVGFQNISKKIDMLNAQQYIDLQNEANYNIGTPDPDFSTLSNWNDIQNGWTGTNWLDEAENKNALIQNHSLNIVGGTEQSIYSIGISDTEQEGIIGQPIVPKYTRYALRINTEHSIIKNKSHDILKFGETLLYTYKKEDGEFGTGNKFNNSLRSILQANPLMPLMNEKGDYHEALTYDTPTPNPIGNYYYNNAQVVNKRNSLIGSIYAEVQPIKNLVFKTNFGFSFNTHSRRAYGPVYYLCPTLYRNEATVAQGQEQRYGYQWENTLSYRFKIKDDHNFSALIGQSIDKANLGESISGGNKNTSFEGLDYAYLSNIQTFDPSGTYVGGAPFNETAISSFFGRVNYDFRETYLLSLIMRADGSSNFARGNRWGYFPSVSAGWVMSNEKFMESTKTWMDFLKIRVSWGQNGNQDIAPFQYMALYSFNNSYYFFSKDKSTWTVGAYPSILQNKDVTWETSEQFDLGFDSRFFDGRLGLTFDWYQKKTKDWLVQAPILASYGAGAPYINGGDVKNNGIELSLNWNDHVGSFNYGATFNVGVNKNKVTRIANNEGYIDGEASSFVTNFVSIYRAQEGYPIGYFYGYKTDGVFQNYEQIDNYPGAKLNDAKPGDLIYLDTNDDGRIDADDRVMIGDPNPNATFGLTLNFAYKGFDLLVVTSGVLGNQIATTYKDVNNYKQNWPVHVYENRWHGEGTSNRYPRIDAASTRNWKDISDIYIENGDYLRIQNVTLGYDFKQLFPKMPLSQARLYMTVQNLYTFTGYYGMEPEIGFGMNYWAKGIDVGMYPTPRTLLFGANIKF